LRKPRILVVEDEIFVAWHLESVLQDLDYAVCGMVPDGESAIVKAEALGADVILMDINLKGDIDGVETARRIRQSGDAQIIFITAYSDAQTLGRIEKIVPGAPVLAKPVSPARLRSAIERALGTRESH
jgi:CheY-like chemotaxis protein